MPPATGSGGVGGNDSGSLKNSKQSPMWSLGKSRMASTDTVYEGEGHGPDKTLSAFDKIVHGGRQSAGMRGHAVRRGSMAHHAVKSMRAKAKGILDIHKPLTEQELERAVGGIHATIERAQIDHDLIPDADSPMVSPRAMGVDGVTPQFDRQGSSSNVKDATKTGRKRRASDMHNIGVVTQMRSEGGGSEYKQLNELIKNRSKRAQLVMINLPDLWDTSPEGVIQYCAYCEMITADLERVLFVHSSGHESLNFNL